MHVLLNEYSFEGQAPTRGHADNLIRDLIQVVKGLRTLRGDNPVHTSRMLWQAEVMPGYTVHQWLKDIQQSHKKGDARKDQMRWLYAIVRKEPFIETVLDRGLAYHECWLQKQDVSSSSLAGAAFYGGILASLQDSVLFNQPLVRVEYREDEGALTKVDIHNAFNPATIDTIITHIHEVLASEISSWDELWNQRTWLFSDLTFCACVYEQLREINFEKKYVNSIRRHLHVMDEYAAAVKNGDLLTTEYHKMGIPASTEDEVTLIHFGYQRNFQCPDEVTRLFTWHSKLYGINYRIHFYPPDGENNNFLIGYIGLHLDTWRYHT